jgi:hypothetical protein
MTAVSAGEQTGAERKSVNFAPNVDLTSGLTPYLAVHAERLGRIKWNADYGPIQAGAHAFECRLKMPGTSRIATFRWFPHDKRDSWNSNTTRERRRKS